jgi:hypothetical protein
MSQVAWPHALWPLVGFALSTMVQPWGRVCGFDPLLQSFLRCAPLVCIVDAATTFIRFVIYLRTDTRNRAAKRVLTERDYDTESHSPGFATWKQRVLKTLVFIIGGAGIYPFFQLVASPGWTKFWACCYLIELAVVAVISSFAKRDRGSVGKEISLRESWLRFMDVALGFAAIFAQYFLLTWADPRATHPDPNLSRRWRYRGIRFSAHLLAFLIHGAMTILHSKVAKKYQKAGYFVMGLLFFLLLIVLLNFDLQYTQVYFLWSISITAAVWFFFSFPLLRENLFLRPAGKGPLQISDCQIVVAFDFLCRFTSMSIYWYVKLYSLPEPPEPGWAKFFG